MRSFFSEPWKSFLGCPKGLAPRSLSLDEARNQIADYVRHYNEERLHSSISHITPKDKMEGRDKQVFTERDQKLDAAREAGKQKRLEEKHRPYSINRRHPKGVLTR